MGLFFPSDDDKLPPGIRRTGFNRYKQLLGRDFKEYYLINVPVLISFLPIGLGIAYAVLSSSMLVLIPVCIFGGMLGGQGLAAMYDFLLRRMRDVEDGWWESLKRSLRQNWRSALLPGALTGLFIGCMVFAVALVTWGGGLTFGSLLLLVGATVLFFMIFSVWWPQRVLFNQAALIQLKNCVLFCITYFPRCLLVALLQTAFWVVFVLFLPFSGFLVPVLSIWYITFLATFLLYDRMNTAFRIEEQIFAQFPEQRPQPDIVEGEYDDLDALIDPHGRETHE